MIFSLLVHTEESMDCEKALIFLSKVFPLVTHAPERRAAINEGVRLNPFFVMSFFTNAPTRMRRLSSQPFLLHVFFAMTYRPFTVPYSLSSMIDTQQNRHRISRGARLPRRRPPGSLRYIESKR